jgi:DNA (cytosine-5)-methyltransferase 1
MTRTPIGIELFCGCGGISTGFLDAGLRIAAGFDIDRRAIAAYDYNHSYRGSRGHVVDLARARPIELLELVGLDRIDVVVGGPPCQPFSIVGKRLGSHDERANLIFHFLRLVDALKPQAVLFENVPNLARIDDGRIFDRLVSGLKRLGFLLQTSVLAACDFGVPQVRRRLFIVGARELQPRFPKQTHAAADLARGHLEPYTTSRQALDDLPPAADFGECGIFNHEPTAHTADMLSRLAKLKPGQREAGSFHDRLHPDRPSFTLRAGTGNFSPLRPIHYKYDRVVTVRESARLQGFCDEFIWPDWIPRLQQYRQVGNAVPPPVAAAIAKELAKQLDWTRNWREFRGVPNERPAAITMTDAERRELRRSRVRGASLGGRARRA